MLDVRNFTSNNGENKGITQSRPRNKSRSTRKGEKNLPNYTLGQEKDRGRRTGSEEVTSL